VIGLETLIATAGPSAANSVAVTSVWDFMLKGGIMMIPIGVCSLLVVAVVVERVMVLRTKAVIPAGFEKGLLTIIKRGPSSKAEALAYCDKRSSAAGRIMRAGIQQFGRPIETVEKHLANAGEHEIYGLRRRLRVLSVVTAAAPLLGLVGTIFGMIRAFQTVALSGESLGKAELLAEGIYEAMISTAAGLLVAIPSLVLYHWLGAKIERLTRELDRICVDSAELLAGKDHTYPHLALVDSEVQSKSNGYDPGLPAESEVQG